jgi:hypothetical protein
MPVGVEDRPRIKFVEQIRVIPVLLAVAVAAIIVVLPSALNS